MNTGGTRPLVLFFAKEAVMSEAEVEERETIVGANVLMLNGNVAANEPVRKCDFVAGDIPDNYADKPKYSKAAVNKFVKQVDAGELPDASKPVEPPEGGGTSHATGEGKPQSDAPPQNPAQEATPLSEADKAKAAAAWGKSRS